MREKTNDEQRDRGHLICLGVHCCEHGYSEEEESRASWGIVFSEDKEAWVIHQDSHLILGKDCS